MGFFLHLRVGPAGIKAARDRRARFVGLDAAPQGGRTTADLFADATLLPEAILLIRLPMQDGTIRMNGLYVRPTDRAATVVAGVLTGNAARQTEGEKNDAPKYSPTPPRL